MQDLRRISRTGGALERTGGAKHGTGGALDRAGVASQRTGDPPDRTGGVRERSRHALTLEPAAAHTAGPLINFTYDISQLLQRSTYAQLG